jgi:hypothetical protein
MRVSSFDPELVASYCRRSWTAAASFIRDDRTKSGQEIPAPHQDIADSNHTFSFEAMNANCYPSLQRRPEEM